MGPAKMVRRCGYSFWINSVQTPKLQPPPLMPQKRSGLVVSLAVRIDPSAVTTVAWCGNSSEKMPIAVRLCYLDEIVDSKPVGAT